MNALNGREMTLGFTEPKDFKEKIHTVKISIEANALALDTIKIEFEKLQQKYESTPYKKGCSI